MLLLMEIKRNILRTPARTLITACLAALLVCSIAFYLQNIQVTQQTLDELSAQMPVRARIITPDGSAHRNLRISTETFDALAAQDVRDVLCTSAFSFLLQSVDSRSANGSMNVHAANVITALDDLEPDNFTYLEGWDEGFLLTDGPVCAIESSFAKTHGIELGSDIIVDVCVISREGMGAGDAGELIKVATPHIKVVALYETKYTQMSGGWNACAPVGWLRNVTEAAVDSDGKPVKFYYDSASAYIETPRELNQFKAGMNERGVYEMSPLRRKDSSLLIGDTLSVDDEMYIKNSSELIENLATLRFFQFPFFGVVVTIIALITFLSLRSYRRDIAIASSLGRQKLLNAAAPFFSTIIVQSLGCFFALLGIWLIVGMVPSLAGTIMCSFMLCAAVGTALALLFLFRFDTLALLTKTD